MTKSERRIHDAVAKLKRDERGAQHVGKCLVEYVEESQNQGWEMSERQLRAVADFLEDLELYVRYSE